MACSHGRVGLWGNDMDRRRLMGNSAVKEIYHPLVTGMPELRDGVKVITNTALGIEPNSDKLATFKSALENRTLDLTAEQCDEVLNFLNNMGTELNSAVYNSDQFILTKNEKKEMVLLGSHAPFYWEIIDQWTTALIRPISPICTYWLFSNDIKGISSGGNTVHSINGVDYGKGSNFKYYYDFFILNYPVYNAELDNIPPSKSPILQSNSIESSHAYAILDEDGNLYESDSPMYLTAYDVYSPYMIWLSADGLKNGNPISRNKNTPITKNRTNYYSDGVSHDFPSCKANFDVRTLRWDYRGNYWNIVTW